MTDPQTVKDAWNMRCPNCGKDEDLILVVETEVRLTPDGTDIFEVPDGSHHWDNTSKTWCTSCNWAGTAGDTEVITRAPFAIHQVTSHWDCEDQILGTYRYRADAMERLERELHSSMERNNPDEDTSEWDIGEMQDWLLRHEEQTRCLSYGLVEVEVE